LCRLGEPASLAVEMECEREWEWEMRGFGLFHSSTMYSNFSATSFHIHPERHKRHIIDLFSGIFGSWERSRSYELPIASIISPKLNVTSFMAFILNFPVFYSLAVGAGCWVRYVCLEPTSLQYRAPQSRPSSFSECLREVLSYL